MTKLTIIFGLLFCFVGTVHAETRGLTVVPVKDASGKTVGLYKGSYALILSVADYTDGWPKLPSVIEETDQIEQALTTKGFSVTRVLNPNDDELEKAFKEFIEEYGYDRDNRLLFFFSGHGYSRKKGAKGYLVPTNAPDPRKDEKGFLRKALPMNQVIAWCRQIEAKHVMFLFDSCFSGTIFKTKALPEIPPHISEITSRPVRQFITAGDAGEEVPAKSVFAASFIRGLHGEADLSRDGYITGSELGMYLRDKVLYYQSGQTPQYGKIRDPDLDEGDFVFVSGRRPDRNAVGHSMVKTPPVEIQPTASPGPDDKLSVAYVPGEWITDFEVAKQIAYRTQKNILAYFTNPNCPYCKKLDSEVLNKRAFRQYAANRLVLFKADLPLATAQAETVGDSYKKLSRDYNVSGTPTVLLLDGNGREISRQTGFKGAKQYFERLLNMH